MAYRAPAGMRAGYRPNRRPVRRRQALMSGTGAYGSSYAARSDAAFLVPPAPPHPGEGIGGEWPLRSFLELGALPGAVPCARLHARQVVWEWGLAGLGDDVEILVSELVTNAVAASRSLDQVLPVRVWLLSDKAHVLVVVRDASPRPQALRGSRRRRGKRPGTAAGGSHQRPVGLVSHAGDRRQGDLGSHGGNAMTVTGDTVPGLGPLESAVMTAVWAARQPLTVRAARERLDYRASGGGVPAYTTVMTVMNILWRKGLLSRAKDLGRAGAGLVVRSPRHPRGAPRRRHPCSS